MIGQIPGENSDPAGEELSRADLDKFALIPFLTNG
jgi:hypothetical protein